MKINVANFQLHPSLQNQELIDDCAQSIAPDDEELGRWFKDYCRGARLRIAGDLDMLDRFSQKGAKVIEFGAIPLLLTIPLAKLGYEVVGVDLEPERFSRTIADNSLSVVRANVEMDRLPFDDGTFDVAIFNELFEHLRINPIFTLGEVNRVLKHDGLLMLSTPNLKSIRGYYNFLIKNKGSAMSEGIYNEYEKLESKGHMGHVREFTANEVCEFLEHMNFDVETVIYHGGNRQLLPRLLVTMIPHLRSHFTCVARAGSK